MLNPARLPTASSELLEPVSREEALNSLRSRLLDPGLGAQGVLVLADAILALQGASSRP